MADRKSDLQYVLSVFWTLVAVLIPLMSIFGRSWQNYSATIFSTQQIGWIILGSLAIVVVLGLSYHLRTINWRLLRHLPWLLIIFLWIPASLSIPVERLHFVTFGIYGYLSMRLFRGPIAIMVCVGLSFGDELLQLWLPNRVGEWRDIGLNTLACCGGLTYAFFVALELKKKFNSKHIK